MAISDSNIAPDKGVFNPSGEFKRRERPDLGTVQEPARDIPVFATTDVLIVGGGPAGTTAAIAAALSHAFCSRTIPRLSLIHI